MTTSFCFCWNLATHCLSENFSTVVSHSQASFCSFTSHAPGENAKQQLESFFLVWQLTSCLLIDTEMFKTAILRSFLSWSEKENEVWPPKRVQITTAMADLSNFTEIYLNETSTDGNSEKEEEETELWMKIMDNSKLAMTIIGLIANLATAITLLKNGQVSWIYESFFLFTALLVKNAVSGADPGFWSGGQQSFDPKGGPEPKICSK